MFHLDKIKWMDKKTKEAAEDKVSSRLPSFSQYVYIYIYLHSYLTHPPMSSPTDIRHRIFGTRTRVASWHTFPSSFLVLIFFSKVQNILEHVGYPKDIMNTTVLEKGYRDVSTIYTCMIKGFSDSLLSFVEGTSIFQCCCVFLCVCLFQVEVNPLTYFQNVKKHNQLIRKMVLNSRGAKPNRQS